MGCAHEQLKMGQGSAANDAWICWHSKLSHGIDVLQSLLVCSLNSHIVIFLKPRGTTMQTRSKSPMCHTRSSAVGVSRHKRAICYSLVWARLDLDWLSLHYAWNWLMKTNYFIITAGLHSVSRASSTWIVILIVISRVAVRVLVQACRHCWESRKEYSRILFLSLLSLWHGECGGTVIISCRINRATNTPLSVGSRPQQLHSPHRAS